MSPFWLDLINAACLTYQLESLRDAREQGHVARLRQAAATEKLRKAMFDIGKTWPSVSAVNAVRKAG